MSNDNRDMSVMGRKKTDFSANLKDNNDSSSSGDEEEKKNRNISQFDPIVEESINEEIEQNSLIAGAD